MMKIRCIGACFIALIFSLSAMLLFLLWSKSDFAARNYKYNNNYSAVAPVISCNQTPPSRDETTAPGMDLYHPSSSLNNLWAKVNDKIIIRRLAFYDTRDLTFPSVVFNCLYDDYNLGQKSKELLYSLLTFKNGSSLCLPLEYWSSTGDARNRKRHLEYYYHYILRTNDLITEAPLYGQISLSSNCSNLSINIPIKNDSVDKVYTYGVCLHKSIYNLSEPEMMVHWIELNLALGAEIMTIYLQPGYIPESYYTIILPYIKRGIVEVLDWGFKPPVVPGYTKDWGQPAVITECVYRNMYRVKYLGLYDLDEFIVPQKVKTIPQMIKRLEKQDHKAKITASYVICNAYFYNKGQFLPEVNSSNLTRQCPKLPRYYTYVLREDISHLHHEFHKVIIKPKAVIAVWTHYVVKHFDKLYSKQYFIPRTEGLTHHYRVPEKLPPDKYSLKTFIMSRYFNDTIQGIKNYTCN